jgi:hypothetical protein
VQVTPEKLEAAAAEKMRKKRKGEFDRKLQKEARKQKTEKNEENMAKI